MSDPTSNERCLKCGEPESSHVINQAGTAKFCPREYAPVIEASSSNARALVEELTGYVTMVSDRIGFARVLQKVEAAIAGSSVETTGLATGCHRSHPHENMSPACQRFADYEEVLADHRRLVRELDEALNGAGVAQQASLCDIVFQLKDRRWKLIRADEETSDSEPQSCTESDGCPTEMAVLKRFWREHNPPMPSTCLHQWKYFETIETLRGGCGFERCELCGTERVTQRRSSVETSAPLAAHKQPVPDETLDRSKPLKASDERCEGREPEGDRCILSPGHESPCRFS